MAKPSGHPRFNLRLARVIEIYDAASAVSNPDLLYDNIKKIIDPKVRQLNSFDIDQLLALSRQVKEWEVSDDEIMPLIKPDDAVNEDVRSHLFSEVKNKAAFIQVLLSNLIQEHLVRKMLAQIESYQAESDQSGDVKNKISQGLMDMYLSQTSVVWKKHMKKEQFEQFENFIGNGLDERHHNLAFSVLQLMRELIAKIIKKSGASPSEFVDIQNMIVGGVKDEDLGEAGDYRPLLKIDLPIKNGEIDFALQQLNAAIRLFHALQLPENTSQSRAEKCRQANMRAHRSVLKERDHVKDIDLLTVPRYKLSEQLKDKIRLVIDMLFGAKNVEQKRSAIEKKQMQHKFWSGNKSHHYRSFHAALEEAGVARRGEKKNKH